MDRTDNIIILTAFLFAANITVAGINLDGRKDAVIDSDRRTEVLEAVDSYLEPADRDAFSESIEDLPNPFMFGEPVEEVVEQEQGVVEEAPKPKPVLVVYDDAAVLKVIAQSFAGQIRGTMAMGDSHYLQLQTGGMLKAGASFPARIPQVKDKVYTVTLTEVTADDFELQFGDVYERHPIPKKEVKSSGSIQIYEE